MTGTGIGFDFSQLMTQFNTLDSQLRSLTVQGEAFGKSMRDMIKGLSEGNKLKGFIDQLTNLRYQIVGHKGKNKGEEDIFGFGKQKMLMNWDSTSLQNYINEVNKLIQVIKAVQNEGKGAGVSTKGLQITGLKKEVKEAQELLAIIKKVEQQQKRSSYDRNTSYSGAIRYSDNVNSLEQERQAVLNLEAARNKLRKTDADYQNKLDKLNIRIQEHNENIRKASKTSSQVAEEERKNADKIAKAKADAFKTPAELISMKGSANSLNELRRYAEQLQRTMATLNPNSKEWSKLNTILQQTNGKIYNIENRMRSFTNESRRATSAAGGLATMIAGVFSAQQIFKYVRQIVNVTGEFEQMHIALNVIIGDLEASNRIWEQTMELAKKSPFQARELVKYTRQLAAYRIETSKLHDTTKMLADVSAGLGVDMSRLILAYGQVRAAEYLRGTELRQFTEAGVPMLDELSKHFTELEGRAISTAEVFDMISKRKVAFEDVSAVLEKMTGAGGPFYKMQEQMSNTIKGSISNLKDEVDLMMYEIGASSSGTIKWFLELLRSLVRNWEKIAAVLKVVTALYVGYNIAALAAAAKTVGFMTALKGATAASGIFTAAIGAATRGIVAMGKAFLATPLGWITLALSAIAGVIWAISDASKSAEEQEKRRAEELKQELDSINKKYEEAKNLIYGITDAFDDGNSSITDASVALHKLVDLAKKEYNLIFNVDVKGKTEEQIIEEGNKIATEMLAIEEDSKMLQTAWEEAWSVSEIYFKRFYNGYKEVGEISQKVGGEEFVTPIMEMAILEDNKTYESNIQDAQAKITQYYDSIKEKIKKESTKLERQSALKMSPMAILEMYFKKKTDSNVSLDATEQTVLHAISTIRSEYTKVAEEIIGATYIANNTDASISRFFNDMIKGNNFTAEQAKELQTVIEGKLGRELHVAEGSLTDWQERFNSFLSKIEDASLKGIDTDAIANLGDKYKKLIEVDGKQVRSNDLARFFEALTPEQEITEEELKKRVKEELDYWKSIKEAYENALAKGLKSIHTEGDYDIAKLAVEFLDPLNTYVGNINKGGSKGRNRAEDANKKRIELLKKMNSQYLNEFKTFGDEAETEIRAAYEKAFGEVFKNTKIKLPEVDFTSKEGMVEALEALKPYAKKAGKDAVDALETEIAKFKGEIKIEARKDLFQKTLDDVDKLFDEYELSLEIKKLNIPPDLAKNLFGAEFLTLDELKVKTKQEFVADVSDVDKAKKLTDELKKSLANIDWNIVEGILGTDQMKELKKSLEKIDDLSRKQREDEAKEFVNFLKKNLDEIQVIQEKGAYNISLADKLFGQGKITSEQYMAAIRQIVEDTNKEVSKVRLDKFKDSPKYIQAMGDMTAYTSDEIRKLIKELEEVVAANSSAFSADEAKEYIDAIYNAQQKLDEIERSPFRWESFANIGEILDTEKAIDKQKEERDRLQEQEKAQLEELIRLEERLKQLQEEKNAILSSGGDLKSKSDRLAFVQSDIDVTTQAIQTGQQAVAATQSQAKTTETILGKLGDKMKGLVGNGGGAAATVAIIDAIINGINDTVQGILELTNEIGAVMESFGKETDMSTGFGKFQKGFSIFAESSQNAADGWNALKNGDPVGAVVSIVKSVTSLIMGMNEYKDAKFQVEIDRQTKEVEKLGKAYEKLEDAIEKAYSTEQLKKYNKELENNINLQRASYNAMITAELSKKNTDEEQVDDWRDELQELEEQWKDLQESMLEGVGGVSESNYRSQTREFVDAWVSAFQETGDGLDGLKNSFREFFDNIIAEQAAIRVTEKFLEPFYKSLNQALDDYEVTTNESKDLRDMVERIAPELSEALEKIWSQLGGSSGETSGSLSELQKGIQGVTEETAQVLEALLNSMRLYVADTNNEIKSQTTYIKRMWQMMDNAVTGSSPFYVQMKTI